MTKYTATLLHWALGVSTILLAATPLAASSLCGSPGDGDGDCRISLRDHADFAACLAGPAATPAPECACYDLNADTRVDLRDAQLMQREFTGTQLLAGCVLPVRPQEPGTRRPTQHGCPAHAPHRAIPDSDVTDSVYLFSGEFHLTEIDLVIRGRGFDFVWARRYRSQSGPDTAMGNGWDYNYNMRLETSGSDLVLHDGDGRQDTYCPDANGNWTHPEYFRELTTFGNGFRMTAHDRSTWDFNGFSGLPDDGKITAMSDRYGNTMNFAYDPAGRLTAVHDTLHFPGNPRGITIAYNSDDRIQSITDFAGRQVTYDYYQNADVGGDAGDLRSVTSPPVVGTPNGNDFPQGKTTVYTYSEGLADPRLNHNLLTVTDPKGQTFLSNTYAPTLNPQDFAFDRVLTQRLGLANEQLSFFYLPQIPSPANNFATTKCIVNDRVGNVEECYYDYRNRCAMIQRFSGRANPAATTTDVANRPTNPLRATDPAFFETRYEYNDESLLTRVIAPEQDQVAFVHTGDLDFFAPQRRRAELRVREGQPGPRGADQPSIMQAYDYDSTLNFDTSQVTQWVDGRGNTTRYEYDPAGNRTRVVHRIPSITEDFEYNSFGQLTRHVEPDNGASHRRATEWVWYPQSAGSQYGYLHQEIVDATAFALTTAYEYDSVGNATRIVDPQGNDRLFTYNALDQVVRGLSREVVPGAGPRYETLRFYDANDNVVRVDVENRDDSGAVQANTHYTTEYVYDILDYVVRKTEEVDAGSNLVTEFEYDGNRNRTVTRLGEATNGNQPTNTETRSYDERDLLFQHVRAPGDPATSSSQYDYDANGNLTRSVQGLQGTNPRESTFAYDGYNRLTLRGDSFGNRSSYEYDSNHNATRDLREGELVDVPGSAGNVRLAESHYAYDPINRLTIKGLDFFDSAQNPLTDGSSTTTYAYSDSSHLLQITDDNSHPTVYDYDTANRLTLTTDAKNNTTRYTYDNNSNVVTELETDKSDLGLPDEVFVSTYAYDGLDRLTSSTDSSSNTHVMGYDSRDNQVVTVDALSNETRYDYDGLNRAVRKTLDLDNDGADGDGLDIVIVQNWDDSSRLKDATDDNGNTTVYEYDSLNRLTRTVHPDGTNESSTYDVHDNCINYLDANGSVVTSTYDLLNRPTQHTIVVAPGVSTDTTFETYTYDGLSRVVSAADDDSVVTLAYDSLSNVVSETSAGNSTVSTYDGVGNRLTCTYPSGRVLSYNYDALDRMASVSEGPVLIANYLYVGPDRVALQQYGNGSRSTFTYDGIQGVPNPPNDFGVRRIVGITHSSGATPVDTREFTWDRMYNKTERRDTRAGGPRLRHAYGYDDAYRLTSGLTEDGFGIVTRNLQYDLDGAGNRLFLGGFGGVTGQYFLDPTAPPADFQMNQYTQTPRDSRQYDENGSLALVATPIGNVDYLYDAYDRLVARFDILTGATVEYAYDALSRRIRKTVVPTQGPVDDTRYFYDGSRVIEDQTSNGTVLASYVHGTRGNDIVCVESGGQIVYHHADDAGNVMALTDTNGAVVERYEYDDYGAPQFLDPAGNPLQGSVVGNAYLFGGHRYDAETGWYLDGSRYLDPLNGRYVTRHAGGAWVGGGQLGNAFDYAGSNPWSSSRAVKKGEDVSLIGFGTFSISKRAARTGRNPQTGKEIKIAAKNKVKFKAGADLSEKVNIAGGGGPPHCPGCGAMLCRCTDAAVSSVDRTCPHHGHVTILKAHGVDNGDDDGAYCGTTDHLAAGGITCPADRPYLCPDGRCAVSMDHCPVVNYAEADACASASSTGSRGRHHGHVTVLKARGAAPAQDYNSSRSNNTNGGIAGPPHCPGCGAMLCRCVDSPTRGVGDGKKRRYNGHVTVLKVAGTGPPHCPGCGAMLCRCTDSPTRGPGGKKKQTHHGHVTVLK
jgi:YD repeat-containing protein